MSKQILTVVDFQKILENRFKTSKIKYIKSEFKPISENVEGFLGEHFNLHITYQIEGLTNTEVFFIKVTPSINEIQIKMTRELAAYRKEIFIYNYLIKEYEKYGFDTSFSTKCYYCIEDKAVVLENLVNKGYVVSDRHVKFNLQQIQCTLKSLALFHAASIAYELTKSKELNKPFCLGKEFPEYLNENIYIMVINPSGFAMNWWKGAYKMLDTLIELMPKDESYKTKFKNFVKNFKYGQSFVDKTDLLKTCGHGDLWSNNMLFKYENTNPVHCTLVDFQICRYFYPCFDVILSIFGNTTLELRKKHLNELYKYYYNCLKTSLDGYGFTIEDRMTYDDFIRSTKLVKVDAYLQVISSVTAINLPKEMIDSFVQNDEKKLEEFMFDNGDMCAESFKENGVYRKLVSEALEEYFDIFVEYYDNVLN